MIVSFANTHLIIHYFYPIFYSCAQAGTDVWYDVWAKCYLFNISYFFKQIWD